MMDIRLIILSSGWSEMWGRRKKASAGNGKTGRVRSQPWVKIHGKRLLMKDRKKVGKEADWLPGKATIVPYGPVPQTDTGRQGEEPKAGGRSIVKELGKMSP